MKNLRPGTLGILERVEALSGQASLLVCCFCVSRV